MSQPDHRSPGRLLASRRFGALFLTQFLGALNDNLFKNALLVLITFHIVTPGMDTGVLVNLSAGLFIVPFFLLSPLAGQLADRLERSRLIRAIKLAEVGVMLLGALALLAGSVPALLLALTLMGLQSALFGPVKYAVLPQLLAPDELVGGNALVELGTFLAILIGTIAGGLAMGDPGSGPAVVGVAVVLLAIAGWVGSRGIPRAPVPGQGAAIDWNPWRAGTQAFRFAYRRAAIWLSIMGISWFWFYGFLFLTQVTPYTRDVLGGSEQVATLLLATFSLGIGLGSLLCERLSGRRVELGLVPLGALGMTVFAIDLAFAWSGPLSDTPLTVSAFLGLPAGWRVLLDIAALSVSAGIFVVPLYAYVQQESPEGERARIIAANNMLNALFMVAAALAAAGFLASGLTIPQLFFTAALMNTAVSVFIFVRIPEFLMRLIVWALIHSLYRVEKQDLQNIPASGAAVLVCNHVSFVDALIVAAVSPRPVRFVMDHRIFATPLLSFVFKVGRAIPIAPARDDRALMEAAFDEVARALRAGDLVCIFPEGRLTADGEMNAFRAGIERIVTTTPVPVVPLALRGLWGSYFSRAGGAAMRGLPRRIGARVSIVSGLPVPPEAASAASLQQQVLALRGDAR
jgi:1-acyl-sn-glycerol-3-phosphate acyltransferase